MGAMCGVLLCGFIILLAIIFAPDKEQKPEDDWDTAEVEETDEYPRVLLVENIRRLTEQGFSQREIGRALGMSQKSVWRIMRKYNIRKADK